MFVTVLTPISAAASAVGPVRKKRNAPVGDISISPFTWMRRPGNALASWSTHQSSRRRSGKERRGKRCSRNSRIRSDFVAGVCGDYGLFVSSSSWRRLPRTSSDWSASSANRQYPLWKLPLSWGEKKELDRRDHRSRKDIPITDFFNTHP